MLSHRKTNGSQQPDVSSGRHRKQALVFTQAVCVCEREKLIVYAYMYIGYWQFCILYVCNLLGTFHTCLEH